MPPAGIKLKDFRKMLPENGNSNHASPSGKLAGLMEAAGDAVFQIAADGRIAYVSRRASLFFGDSELTGTNFSELLVPSDRAAFSDAFGQAMQSFTPIRISARMQVRDAAFRWFEWQLAYCQGEREAPVLLAVGRDITEQWATEERLRHMATHDMLTGLPNRFLLSDRIRMAIAHARRTHTGFSVITLDLDGFKKVNDAFGHVVGDALLCIAGQRLRETLRDIDTLAHVSGDEFVAVLPGAIDDAEIQKITRRLIAVIQLPFQIEEHTLYMSTSIGCAIYPDHGDTEVKLLAHADTAMHRAKETGKSRCVIYDRQQFAQPKHDVSMEAAMFDAVRNGEFMLHYQPVVDAHTRQIVGFEALMRWHHPELGDMPPAQFIPMAEDNGLINLLGAWALKAACVQIRRFEQEAGRRLYVSVNVSPRQFRNDQFLSMIDEALAFSGLGGDRLLLEITEGILMSDPEHAEALLTAIAQRNIRIAIDDFGTGYSSLAYLKRFPIHVLKIDRAFIKDLPGSVKDAAICNVVLSLATHLKLSTIAEGVEDERQLAFLAGQGCALVQGFYTGTPLPPQNVPLLLRPGVESSRSLAGAH